jgi:hypothetical protein
VEEELQDELDRNSNIKPLSSTLCQEIVDREVLLGESDRAAETGLLDSSIESLENTGWPASRWSTPSSVFLGRPVPNRWPVSIHPRRSRREPSPLERSTLTE